MKDLIFIIILIVLCTAFYHIGKGIKQREIVEKTLTMNKECYNAQDLEYFIFGEIQE